MKLKFITDFDELQQYAQQWDEVAGDFPFYRFSWMGNWIRHLGKSCQLAVLVATDEIGNWIGVAPWCIDRNHNFTRRLRWLSSGAACADYLNLFTRPGYEAAFADVAVRWLSRNIGPQKLLGRLDEIELEGIALDQPEVAYFNNKMTKAGFQNHQTEIEGCWAVDLPKSWADLEQTFSKSMRRKTKKATKRLNEKDTAVRSSHKADFDELWSTFVLLHQKRRQMLGQSGCFADTAFEAFLRDAVRELATSGHAEIVEIQHAGQPLASMILLNDNKTVYMFQSGTCDQRSALEPGYQLAACAIQRSINMGFACFDFLRGDEPYKARWNTNRVTLSRVKFIPRNFTAQLKHSLWLTGRSLKEHVYAGA